MEGDGQGNGELQPRKNLDSEINEQLCAKEMEEERVNLARE